MTLSISRFKEIQSLAPLAAAFLLLYNPLTHFPVTFGVIILFIIGFTIITGNNLQSLGMKSLTGKDIAIALTAFVVIETGMDFIIQPLLNRVLNEPADYSSFSFLQGNAKRLLTYLLYMWVSAALGEELLFRAFVIDRLQLLTQNKVVLAFASALLFSVPHLYQGATGLAATFLFGLAFAALYLRYRNLWINVLVHGLVDSLFLMLSYCGALSFYQQ